MLGLAKDWMLSESEELWISPCYKNLSLSTTFLMAMLRVRDEGLILKDTLNHLAEFADVICAYDDASTDNTFEILSSHPKVALIIRNKTWLSGYENRLICETRHRGLLLKIAREHFDPVWLMYCDADERYIGGIRDFVTSIHNEEFLGVRIKLFDAYMTQDDDAPFKEGDSLMNFRKYFGPEFREILMLWRNSKDVQFVGLDSREPIVSGPTTTLFYCQHYGKSLSYQHWEDTCNYYVDHFPWETYGKKWSARKGGALHELSDFGSSLFGWGEELFKNEVPMP